MGGSAASPGTPAGSKSEPSEAGYLAYLHAARAEIGHCVQGTKCWSLAYDGDNTPLDSPEIFSELPDLGDSNTAQISNTIGGSTESTLSSLSDSSEAKDVELEQKSSDGLSGDKSRSSLPIDTESKDGLDTTDTDNTLPSDIPSGPGHSSDCDGSSVIPDIQPPTAVTQNGISPSPGEEEEVNNSELNVFLLSLKRVKTPVELIEDADLDDSFTEIDAIANQLKSQNLYSRHTSTSSLSTLGLSARHRQSSGGDSLPVPPIPGDPAPPLIVSHPATANIVRPKLASTSATAVETSSSGVTEDHKPNESEPVTLSGDLGDRLRAISAPRKLPGSLRHPNIGMQTAFEKIVR